MQGTACFSAVFSFYKNVLNIKTVCHSINFNGLPIDKTLQEFYYIDIENVFKVDYLMLIFVKKERNME